MMTIDWNKCQDCGKEFTELMRHTSNSSCDFPVDELRRLYKEESMSTAELGEVMGISQEAARYRLEKFGIDRREPPWEKVPPFLHTEQGYEYWQHRVEGEKLSVYVHRLLAVAEFGIEEVKDKHVHHTTHVPWDNRPDVLELMEPGEHGKHHSNIRWGNKSVSEINTD